MFYVIFDKKYYLCTKIIMPIGRVIKSTGSWYEVQDDNGTVWSCRLRGKMRLDGLRTTNPVAVGDKVNFEKNVIKILVLSTKC